MDNVYVMDPEKFKQAYQQAKPLQSTWVPMPVPNSHPCPSCGRCPTCGRGGYYAPYWQIPIYPWNTNITYCNAR